MLTLLSFWGSFLDLLYLRYLKGILDALGCFTYRYVFGEGHFLQTCDPLLSSASTLKWMIYIYHLYYYFSFMHSDVDTFRGQICLVQNPLCKKNLFFFAWVVKGGCLSATRSRHGSFTSICPSSSELRFIFHINRIWRNVKLQLNHCALQSFCFASKCAFMQSLIFCHFSSPTKTSGRICGFEEYEILQK